MAGTVIDALCRFIPDFLKERPSLTPDQWRAVRAIQNCRTSALGAEAYFCPSCNQYHLAFHSCNHKACPQCGRQNTVQWVQRQLGKLVDAPYFMVVFTLPSEFRPLFLGPYAKLAYDLFFKASSRALADKLSAPNWLGAVTHGFTGVLHTWNQQLLPHPHIHYIVSGAGLDANGNLVKVKSHKFIVPIGALRIAFRSHFLHLLKEAELPIDPSVKTKDWGVNIKSFGTGINAVKYLGAYVSRTAIGDRRILNIGSDSVTFSWKDRRQGGKTKTSTVKGVEFVKRYLRHVLPRGFHSIRHYGFCHPAAKKKRARIQSLTGRPSVVEPSLVGVTKTDYLCPVCKQPMQRTYSIRPGGRVVAYLTRGPPLLNQAIA